MCARRACGSGLAGTRIPSTSLRLCSRRGVSRSSRPCKSSSRRSAQQERSPAPGGFSVCARGMLDPMETRKGFASIEEAIEELRAGRLIIVVDDEDRENEGDLMVAAEFCTPEAINFMARFGRGLICLTLTEERADYLRLSPMVQENSSRFGTAFTESIEAREGVTTGISAADRARTIRVAIAPEST